MTLNATSHIGPVSQIVHYAYQSISCGTFAWAIFRDDAYSKLNDQIFNLNFFLFDIKGHYNNFRNPTGKKINPNRKVLDSFIKKTENAVGKVNTSFLTFNQSLQVADVEVKNLIDNEIRVTYDKSVSAIYDSIVNNKNCVLDIIQAQRGIFDGLIAALKKCTNQMIDFEVINYQLSTGFGIQTNFFIQLQRCLSNGTARRANICVRRVSTSNWLDGLLIFRIFSIFRN